jgi:putative nucleotidyltransferase with HDIG domain
VAKPGENEFSTLFNEMVKTLISVIEEKDTFVRGHSDRVAGGSIHFAREIGVDRRDIDRIYLAALLHDIGMVYVPQAILLKTDSLTDDEMAVVKSHPVIAEKILSNLSIIQDVLPLIRHHHEKFDGSGYPDGIKGEDIPVGARIIALFDCYDAMVSPRPHRPAFSKDKALREIAGQANKQFDGKLVKRFLEFIVTHVPPTGILRGIKEEEDQAAIRESVKNIVNEFRKGKIDLPVLPRIIEDVQKVIRDPKSDSEDLAKIIENDAVISVRLISVANSPIYRGAEDIVTVRKAIPRMGTNETQNIISSIANKSLYESKNEHFQMTMEGLWRHSFATATAAKMIVQRTVRSEPDRYYMLGLLHDIGKVLLLKAFSEIIPKAEEFNMTQIMDTIQGYHADFGGALLQRWKFSGEFINVVKNHETPQIDADTPKEIIVISLANLLTRKIGFSLIDEEGGELSETPAAQVLSLDAEKLEDICRKTEEIVQTTVNTL